MKPLRYALEALLLLIVLGFFRLLPLDAASSCGGWIGRTFGPVLPGSRTIRINLRLAGFGDDDRMLRAVWDNLGRVMAETPHLRRVSRERVEIVNPQILPRNTPFLCIGGHIANWEVMMPAMLRQLGIALDTVYRAPNNPFVTKIITRLRANDDQKLIPKSKTSARDFIHSITHGRPIGMLIDQKYNEGIAVPFFGRPAMTSTDFVKIPQKYGCALIPVRAERLLGAHFRVTFYDPIPVENRAAEDVIADAHRLLESWIRERPEQWLWLHRRWPRELYAS